jgi:predicted nuclease of predicted toxin-antitoxin system
MLALLADENLARPVTRALRQLGYDVVHMADQLPGAADLDVLAFARSQGRVLITHDADHGTLIFRDGCLPSPAVIYLRSVPRDHAITADHIVKALGAAGGPSAFLTVGRRGGVRTRPFPGAASPALADDAGS